MLFIFVLVSLAQVLADGYYVIRYAEKPEYVLTVTNYGIGKDVVVCEWENKESQIWKVENQKNGSVVIRAIHQEPLILNIADNKIRNNTKTILSPKERLWVPERQGNGTIVLMLKENKNYCLDLMNGLSNAKNNGIVEIRNTHKGAQEQWKFERVDNQKPVIPEGIYAIKSPMSTVPLALTLKDGKLAEDRELVTDNWKNSNSQKWKVTHEKDGTIAIRSMMDANMVICLRNEKITGIENRLVVKKWNGSVIQRWKPKLFIYDDRIKTNIYFLRYPMNWNMGIRVTTYQPRVNNYVDTGNIVGMDQDRWIFELLESLPSGNNGSSNNSGNSGNNSNNTGKNTTDNTSTSTSSSNLIPEGVYIIKSAGNTDYVMTLKDGKATNRNQIVISKWQNTNAQKWKVTHEKNGTIVIRSMVDDKYAVNVNENQMNNNAQIISWLYEKASNEQWVPVKQSNGNYVLKVKENKNFVLDVEGATYSNNVNVQLYGLNGGANQQWVFQKTSTSSGNFGNTGNTGKNTSGITGNPGKNSSGNSGNTGNSGKNDPGSTSTTTSSSNLIPEGVYIIKCSGDPNYVLTLKGNKVGNDVVVYQWKDASSQKWKVENAGDGSIIIRSMADNKYTIGVDPNGVFDHAMVVSELYNGKKNDRWVPQKNSKGYFFLKLLANKDYYMDVLDFNYFDNNTVQACGYWGDHNQQFIFQSVKGGSSSSSGQNTGNMTPSQLNTLGIDYYQGRNGKKVDYVKAAECFRKAAEKGYAASQRHLGYMYEKGEGVKKDHAEALKWYQKSANQGFAQAQYDMGRMYQNGTGVKRNITTAKSWYQKAADQGYEKARKKLEEL